MQVCRLVISLVVTFFVAVSAQAGDLHNLKPVKPADNDRLIKEYMASKDGSYIRNMLETYAEADDTMLRDARRYAHLFGQFKNPKSPRTQMANTVSVAVCAKYECKKNPKRRDHFMMIASGMWALDSLARQDPKFKEIVAAFLKGNRRMSTIYAEEGAMFGNYMTLVGISIVVPDKLDAILKNCETLGPLDLAAVQKALEKK